MRSLHKTQRPFAMSPTGDGNNWPMLDMDAWLKEATNTKARLAKSNDLMREQLDNMGRDLYLARSRLEEAGLETEFAAPTTRARPKLPRVAESCEMNDQA